MFVIKITVEMQLTSQQEKKHTLIKKMQLKNICTHEVKSHKSPAKRPKSAPFFSSSPIARIIVTGKSKKHLAPQTSGKRP